MKPPFDIAADLDTPVSAYLKLAPFRPRFLLESVEGGERWRVIPSSDSATAWKCGWMPRAERRRCAFAPAAIQGASCLNALRGALKLAPQPMPEVPGVPLLGGLVGYTAYDAVRYFERVPGRSLDDTVTPHAHYVAPRSLLVFDHLTRRWRCCTTAAKPSGRLCAVK
jgi:anthranilate synthase component 1